MQHAGSIRALLAFATATMAGVAAGQTIVPLGPLNDSPAPTREWSSLVERKSGKDWDVRLSFRMCFDNPCPTSADQSPKPVVTQATFVLPWVLMGATQRTDPETVAMRGWLKVDEVPQPSLDLSSFPGMQRQRGLPVAAPAGQVFRWSSEIKNSKSGNFSRGTWDEPPALFFQGEVSYRCRTHDVVLNQREAEGVRWPNQWPPEAWATFEKQAYLDLDFDSKTGLAAPLDQDLIRKIAMNVLNSGGVKDPKDVSPMALAQAIAASVLPELKPVGTAQLFSAHTYGLVSHKGIAFVDATPGADVPPIVGTSAGFYVRNVLTVMETREANDAERACVLAALYRAVGLPARVMIGFEAERSDESKLARRLADVPGEKVGRSPDELRRQIEERDNKQREKLAADQALKAKMKGWPGAPMLRWPMSKGSSWPSHAGNSPSQASMTPWPAASSQPKALSPMERYARELLKASNKLKRARFWVEFAAVDPEKGLAWVPVDPGQGGNDWRFGTIEDSERVVVVATNFWPTTISQLSTYSYLGSHQETGLFGVDSASRIWHMPCLSRVVKTPALPQRMPAGLWGMFTGPQTAVATWQEIGFQANRASVTSMP